MPPPVTPLASPPSSTPRPVAPQRFTSRPTLTEYKWSTDDRDQFEKLLDTTPLEPRHQTPILQVQEDSLSLLLNMDVRNKPIRLIKLVDVIQELEKSHPDLSTGQIIDELTKKLALRDWREELGAVTKIGIGYAKQKLIETLGKFKTDPEQYLEHFKLNCDSQRRRFAWLVEQGADPFLNFKNKIGQALSDSIIHYESGLLKACLTKNKEACFALRDYSDCPLLIVATQVANLEATKLLLEAGAPPNTREKDGTTPLFWAAGTSTACPHKKRHLEITKLLLGRGADTNPYDRMGYTPIMAHCKVGAFESAKLLLDAGADPTVVSFANKSILDYCAGDTLKDEVKQLVRKHYHANPNATYTLFTRFSQDYIRRHKKNEIKPLPDARLKELNIDTPAKLCELIRKVYQKYFLNSKQLDRFLRNIEHSSQIQATPANPVERHLFYRKLRDSLGHIAEALEDPNIDQSLKKNALYCLGQASTWCGTRHVQEISIALNILKTNNSLTDDIGGHETKIRSSLTDLRHKLVGALVKVGRDPHNPHIINQILKEFGEELDLPMKEAAFNDPYNAPHNAQDSEYFRHVFSAQYSPHRISAELYQAVAKKQIGGDGIHGLLRDNRPSADYLENFYNNFIWAEDYCLQPEAAPYLLLALGIIEPMALSHNRAAKEFGLESLRAPIIIKLAAARHKELLDRKLILLAKLRRDKEDTGSLEEEIAKHFKWKPYFSRQSSQYIETQSITENDIRIASEALAGQPTHIETNENIAKLSQSLCDSFDFCIGTIQDLSPKKADKIVRWIVLMEGDSEGES